MQTIGKSSAAFALLLILSSAQADDVAIPVIGQPTPFHGAAGMGVTAEASVDRAELTLAESVVLTLRIRRLVNAADVHRPDLSAIEAFSKDFQIEDDDVTEAQPAGTRIFQYRLRPRRATVASIPAIDFPYYDPARPQPPDRPDFPFLVARSSAIPIRIRKAEATMVPAVPLEVPDFATTLAEPTSADPPTWVWYWAALGPPIVAICWCAIWTIMNPAGARLARRRRSRAARTALRRLHALSRRQSADPAAIVECVQSYLAERYTLPNVLRTPDGLAWQLTEVEAGADTVAQCVRFLHSADTARFAPGPTVAGDVLIAEAEQLIRQQEGEA